MSADEAHRVRGPGSELPLELIEDIVLLAIDACFAAADQDGQALDGCAEYSPVDDVYLYAGYRDALKLQIVCQHWAHLVGSAILRDLTLPAGRFEDWRGLFPRLFEGRHTGDLSLIRSIHFDLDILKEGRYLRMTDLRHLTIRTNGTGYRLRQVAPYLPALETINVPCPGPLLALTRDLATVGGGLTALSIHGDAPRYLLAAVRVETLTLVHPRGISGGIQWQSIRKLTLVFGDCRPVAKDILDDLDKAVCGLSILNLCMDRSDLKSWPDCPRKPSTPPRGSQTNN